MLRVKAFRSASAFCAAAAVASVLSVGSAGAAALFSLTGTPDPAITSLPGTFNPTVSIPMGALMAADGIGVGTPVTVYDATHLGGLQVSPQLVNIQFQFIGHEAQFTDTTWVLSAFNTQIFNNQTSASGDLSLTYAMDVGSDPGIVPFKFTAVNPGNLDAVNGGPIASGLLLAFAKVTDSIYYAFFDDSGGTKDADLDDVVLRITATVRGDETNPTPLPAALPLFASGLGGLGFLSWRRKRKKAAAAAA